MIQSGKMIFWVADGILKDVEKVLDEHAEQLLARFKSRKRSIEQFKSELSKFLAQISTKDRAPPLFVLVDELDRCRPTYAIALLERVKHLFATDNVVFVFATDARQLQHAVGAVYGAAFDSKRYLLRFFDRTYEFEAPSLKQFVAFLVRSFPFDQAKLALPPASTLETFFAEGASYFGLSLRDTEQCYEILRSIVTVWDYEIAVELIILFPLIVAHQQGLNVELGENVGERLKELANKNNGQKDTWHFDFRKYSQSSSQIEHLSGIDLLTEFCAIARKPLPEVARPGGSNERPLWIYGRLSFEYMRASGNISNPATPPLSSIWTYPKLVRSAGRLVPTRD